MTTNSAFVNGLRAPVGIKCDNGYTKDSIPGPCGTNVGHSCFSYTFVSYHFGRVIGMNEAFTGVQK